MNDRFKFRGVIKLDTQSIVIYSSFLNNYNDELILELSEEGLDKQIINAGYKLTKEDWGVLEYYSDKDDYDPTYYLQCESVEQCTGLKDKSGKLIYEGDIIDVGYIGWCEKEKSFEVFTSTDECLSCSGDVLWQEIVENPDIEVIGNIHENKEFRE